MTANNVEHAILDSRSWDKTEALSQLGGDEELLQELIALFMDESSELLDGVREAIAVSDAKGIIRGAHSIKGEVSCLGAHAASASAEQLEAMAAAKNFSGVAETFADLEGKISALRTAFIQFLGPRP
jgi:HPt (histidine-containing phosphotransfer) domain-containing protein